MIRPRSGSISRLIIRSVVVLPQPDGPISTQAWPSGMSSDRSSTAFDPPAKPLLTCSRVIVGIVVVGLESVSADVIGAAIGMGYRPYRRLVQIELLIALPAIFAGVKIANVATIGLVTITAVIGLGGLGELILEGLVSGFR